MIVCGNLEIVSRFVGVTLPHFALRSLKRNALLFEQNVIFELPGLIRLCRDSLEYQGQRGPVVAKTLEWLEERGIIVGITADNLGAMSSKATPSAEAFRSQINDAMSKYIEESDRAGTPVLLNEVGSGDFIADIMARAVALAMRDKRGVDAVSTIAPHPVTDRLGTIEQDLGEVVSAVLAGLPVPDETTAWEAIIEFRDDPTAMTKLLALRRWMRQMATSSPPPTHLTEEIEWLLHEYEDHMKLHQLKIKKGTLEMIVTLAAGLLEDVIKLKLQDAVGLLFERNRRRIALMEAERNAPGRELAYLSRAKSAFGKP
jgi:hypothetical protein